MVKIDDPINKLRSVHATDLVKSCAFAAIVLPCLAPVLYQLDL